MRGRCDFRERSGTFQPKYVACRQLHMVEFLIGLGAHLTDGEQEYDAPDPSSPRGEVRRRACGRKGAGPETPHDILKRLQISLRTRWNSRLHDTVDVPLNAMKCSGVQALCFALPLRAQLLPGRR